MAVSGKQSASQPRTRASREARRAQLIDATLTVIARKGLRAVTLADVADEAGLSHGIVNFHFESKEKLLLATLTQLSTAYDTNWREALAEAPDTPAARMRVLIVADLGEEVCGPRKLGAWFGFYGEAASRPDYRDLCWARDDGYIETVETLCRALNRSGGYDHDPRQLALAVYAMQEGLWLRLMLGSDELSRLDAQGIALAMLGTLFPHHFTPEGDLRAPR